MDGGSQPAGQPPAGQPWGGGGPPGGTIAAAPLPGPAKPGTGLAQGAGGSCAGDPGQRCRFQAWLPP